MSSIVVVAPKTDIQVVTTTQDKVAVIQTDSIDVAIVEKDSAIIVESKDISVVTQGQQGPPGGGGPFTESFTSSLQAVPAAINQSFSVAHGLSGVPKIVRLVAVCQSAVNGYSIGDEAEVTVGCVDNGNLNVLGICADATNVNYISGNSMLIANRTNQYYYNIINQTTYWKLKIYAFY